MFTGLITDIGKLKSRIGNTVTITAPKTVSEIKTGDSVSVNGICLTVIKTNSNSFSADLLAETIAKTNIGKLRVGDPVNLELALKVGDRLGGHIVTGHVDYTGKVIRKYKKIKDTVLEIEAPIFIAKKLMPKWSIAINGVSLTVVRVLGKRFTVHLIPYTQENTNLGQCRIGELVNIELDKYRSYD